MLGAVIARLAGGDDSDKPGVEDSLDTMFCSKLIAVIFKDIGLLAPHRVSADFLPKHFSAAYDGYLDLQRGAILGPELPINFDSVKTNGKNHKSPAKRKKRWWPSKPGSKCLP